MDTRVVVERLRKRCELANHLAAEQSPSIWSASQALATALKAGHKLLLFGNGGSAADAQHIAAEFVGRFVLERRPLPAIALTTDTSALTSISNDYGFEEVFSRQLLALGRPGDVVLAISTSGNSPNVLAGAKAAREHGIKTIGLTGGDGGQLARCVDISIVVPSDNTARVQEWHITIGHILCEIVENLLFSQEETENAPAPASKVVDRDALVALRQRWRSEGKTVVWTNGCFDLLHVGHVRSLQTARSLGNVVVVGVNSDRTVQQLKGPNRPLVPASQRAEVLAALESVDYVVIFDDATPEAILSLLEPEIHCKGVDYAPPQGEAIPEAEIVEAYGGRVEFLPLVPSVSTSGIIRRIEGEPETEDKDVP